MARSFVGAAELVGFPLRVASPEGFFPAADEMARAVRAGCATFGTSARQAARGADVVNTDVWTSMGQEEENARRMAAFAGWTVDDAMLDAVAPHAIVLHCLPAHRGEEISNEVIEGPRSRVWDQAENRLHVQKALLMFLMDVA